MLVGAVDLREERKLFQFLWDIESVVQIDKDDPIGCSTTTVFNIELLDPQCKPVCHDVRKCSKVKQDFIDSEVEKLLA